MMLMACTAIHLGDTSASLSNKLFSSDVGDFLLLFYIAFSMVADALHAAYMM
jgi:hypothetical protein